jgi:hypothetical protein
MITQGDGNVDFAAVAADDALLDLLAARAEVPADDALAGLLAAFADEVDDGLAALLASAEATEGTDRPALAAVPAVSIVPDLPEAPVRPSHGLRAATIALVVGATLSVSGVAAAVTGDPFAPYRGIVSAVTGGDDESAAHAAKVAWLQRQLAGTRARVAHGDLAGADADLATMRARLAATDDLSKGQRTALEARIAAVEAALARAQDRATDDTKQHGSSGNGPAVTPGPSSTKPAEPQNTKTPEPQSTRANQPQNTKSPEPQNTKSHQPQNTKQATPETTEAPDPESTTAAQPQSTKKATPQNTKKATPLISTTAASTDAEQSSAADSHGSAKAERPAR